jgi:hypothetical protein
MVTVRFHSLLQPNTQGPIIVHPPYTINNVLQRAIRHYNNNTPTDPPITLNNIISLKIESVNLGRYIYSIEVKVVFYDFMEPGVPIEDNWKIWTQNLVFN